MSRVQFIFAFFFLSVRSFAQTTAMTCPCSTLFRESVQKITTIYAGFDDKVTKETRPAYDQLLKRLKNKAAVATSERNCYEIINAYMNWFRDNHVGVSFTIQSSAAALRKIDLSKLPANKAMMQQGLEGIWTTADKKERYTIIKDPLPLNKFIAVAIANPDSAWEPGMVKMEFYDYDPKTDRFRGMFYLRNFQGVLDGFKLDHAKLDHWWGSSWYREGTVIADPEPVATTQEPVQFKIINDDFIYLKLGRFWGWHVHLLDSMINANRTTIYKTRNVIIDLRGNGGGDGSSSKEMIQLIYTNPIVYPSWQYKSSPELIKSTEEDVALLIKNDPYKLLRSRQLFLERLRMHPGQMVSSGDSIVRKADSVAHYPERVAILNDEGSGSSSEFFVFEGRQSKKVTTFGVNTGGGMDYGNVQQFNLSCSQFSINIPWGRNGWIERFGIRIDNIGFKPDVRIPANEPDWIAFVVKYWSK